MQTKDLHSSAYWWTHRALSLGSTFRTRLSETCEKSKVITKCICIDTIWYRFPETCTLSYDLVLWWYGHHYHFRPLSPALFLGGRHYYFHSLSIGPLENKTRLLHFWSFPCGTCIMPDVTSLSLYHHSMIGIRRKQTFLKMYSNQNHGSFFTG